MKLEDIPYLTHEVGSLRKPKALLKASSNQKLDETDFKEFNEFCNLIRLEDNREIIELLREANPSQANNETYHNDIAKWRVKLNVLYKESTGIDLIDSGEWIRREMYQHLVDNDAVTGIKLLNHVRSFDYNFYRPGIYEHKINYDESKEIHLQEFLWAKEVATKPLKVCMTAFNTVTEWSYKGIKNFDDFMFETIDKIFVPETIKLLKAGVNWIQMDEPALTTHPGHLDSFVDAWNYWISKVKSYLKSDTIVSIHNCFSNYDLLWPILPELNKLGSFTLEFANRDTWKLGVDDNSRIAYYDAFKPLSDLYQGEIGFNVKAALGVLPVHTDHETKPELIRDRLLYINNIIEDPRLILAAPDCGLRQRSLPVSHKALTNLTKGANLAREE